MNKFLSPYSSGHEEVIYMLKKQSKKISDWSTPKITRSLQKKIAQFEQDLASYGIPPHLQIAPVNAYIQAGVFLKKESLPIEPGDFIGIYAGNYELVLADEHEGNHYAYDVAQEVKVKKSQLSLVCARGKKISTRLEYSIQTNALYAGNFTRYINHSSLEPNIEAVTKKLPDGTIEVFLFATQRIRPGEQLLSNYGGLYWAVLPIVPEDVTPRTYQIDSKGQVTKKEKRKSEDTSITPYLLPLRNTLEPETGDLPENIKTKIRKSSLLYTSKDLADKIEAFEEIVLEKGIPRHLKFTKQNDTITIALKKEAKAIKKGDFVAILGGRWNVSSKAPSQKALKTPFSCDGKTLYLDIEQKGNFASYLLSRSLDGNLSLRFYKKRGVNGLYFVIRAQREIKAGETLFLSR